MSASHKSRQLEGQQLEVKRATHVSAAAVMPHPTQLLGAPADPDSCSLPHQPARCRCGPSWGEECSCQDRACPAACCLLCDEPSSWSVRSTCVIEVCVITVLQVWDLLDRSHEPSLTIAVSSCAVTSLAFSNSTPKHFTHGTMAAGGSDNITVGPVIGGSSAGSTAAAGMPGQHQHHGSSQPQQGSGLQVYVWGVLCR